MSFSVEFRTAKLDRKLDTLAVRARDLDKPLGQFGAHLVRKAREIARAQDFAPLAASTVEKRAEKGLRTLERKLHRDVKRARARARAGNAPPGLLARLLGISAHDVTQESRGQRARLSVLAEFQRQHRRGGALADRGDLQPLSFKQALSLSGREQRAVARAVGAPILGKIPATLVVERGRNTVTVAERTHEHWTEAHNAGGTVGHGAKLPERETLRIDEADMHLFGEMLKEHHLAAFDEE